MPHPKQNCVGGLEVHLVQSGRTTILEVRVTDVEATFEEDPEDVSASLGDGTTAVKAAL